MAPALLLTIVTDSPSFVVLRTSLDRPWANPGRAWRGVAAIFMSARAERPFETSLDLFAIERG
jgi:hypothetical protein